MFVGVVSLGYQQHCWAVLTTECHNSHKQSEPFDWSSAYLNVHSPLTEKNTWFHIGIRRVESQYYNGVSYGIQGYTWVDGTPLTLQHTPYLHWGVSSFDNGVFPRSSPSALQARICKQLQLFFFFIFILQPLCFFAFTQGGQFQYCVQISNICLRVIVMLLLFLMKYLFTYFCR